MQQPQITKPISRTHSFSTHTRLGFHSAKTKEIGDFKSYLTLREISVGRLVTGEGSGVKDLVMEGSEKRVEEMEGVCEWGTKCGMQMEGWTFNVHMDNFALQPKNKETMGSRAKLEVY